MFEQQSGYNVKTVAVGTGAALALGARGEADVVLVHAPASEVQWMQQGYGTERLLVMYNDFVIVGPDPIQPTSKATRRRWMRWRRSPRPARRSCPAAITQVPISSSWVATGKHHTQRPALVHRKRHGHEPDADHRRSEGQVIGSFGMDKYGQQLFVPDAGKSESDVGL